MRIHGTLQLMSFLNGHTVVSWARFQCWSRHDVYRFDCIVSASMMSCPDVSNHPIILLLIITVDGISLPNGTSKKVINTRSIADIFSTYSALETRKSALCESLIGMLVLTTKTIHKDLRFIWTLIWAYTLASYKWFVELSISFTTSRYYCLMFKIVQIIWKGRPYCIRERERLSQFGNLIVNKLARSEGLSLKYSANTYLNGFCQTSFCLSVKQYTRYYWITFLGFKGFWTSG